MEEFEIENGVLVRYNGSDGRVVVPEGVTRIKPHAFLDNKTVIEIVLPEGVTDIGRNAFVRCNGLTQLILPESLISIGSQFLESCDSLTQITLPKGVSNIDCYAFDHCRNLHHILVDEKNPVFKSVDGLLIRDADLVRCPEGKTGVVALPEGITKIEYNAFNNCTAVTGIIIPEGVTEISRYTFQNCKSLSRVLLPNSIAYIGEGVLQIEMLCDFDRISSILREKDGSPHRIINCFRSTNYCGPFVFPVDKESAECFDRVVAEGKYEINRGGYENYQMPVTGRIEAALYRLVDKENPVADELRPTIKDFLEKRVTKAIKFAEDVKKPGYIRAMVEFEAINGTNMDAVKKRLKSSKVPEIRELSENIGQQVIVGNEPTKEVGTGGKSVKPIAGKNRLKSSKVPEIRELSETIGQQVIVGNEPAKVLDTGGEYAKPLNEYYGINALDLPAILKKDGTPLSLTEKAKLLVIHERFDSMGRATPVYTKSGISDDVQKIVDELDNESFQNWLIDLVDKYMGKSYKASKKDNLALPICRYADEKTMENLCKRAPGWMSKTSGVTTSSFWKFSQAVCFSNTHAALVFAEKYGTLGLYANIRGLDEDTVRDKWFSDVGLDEAGEKRYDLGNQTVTIKLQPDFKYAMEDGSGKVIKSIPKRGADHEKYERAVTDFDKTCKETRNIVKRRFNSLFDDFLRGRTREIAAWKDSYLRYPLLRQAAGMIVWAQGANTFIMTAVGPVDSVGQPYTISDEGIAVAHPMNMDRADLRRWQDYFISHGIKQPFEQVWEPVTDPKTIRPDRYKGMEVSAFRFMHMEKHGISFYDTDFHNEIGFSLEGCSLDYERTDWHRHEIAKDETFTLGTFSFKIYTRQVNHIVSLLDRWTVSGRILHDDVTVRNVLDNFTAAQIMEFTTLAAENNAPNCAAMLLEYKQEHYPDLDPLAEFTLEL